MNFLGKNKGVVIVLTTIYLGLAYILYDTCFAHAYHVVVADSHKIFIEVESK